MRPPPALLPPWRLFLPLAALWGAVVVGLTVAARQGLWVPPGPWDLAHWHLHEMIFGHVLAGFAGVLLTALPRWTGCRPLAPATVVGLAALWLAGRLAALLDPTATTLLLSPLFPAALAAVTGGRVLDAHDRRDLPLAGLLAVLAVADLGTVVAVGPLAEAAGRLGLAAMVAIAAVMGGRVAPALTRHLALGEGRDLDLGGSPRFEVLVTVTTAAALLAWVVGIGGILAAGLFGLAALLHLRRLAHWRGWTALARPSILALHLGYAGLPVGFALLGLDALGIDARLADAGLHAIGVGLLGLMCFAVQASVARRHLGRALARDLLAETGAAAFLVAVVARLMLAGAPAAEAPLIAAAIAWIVAEAMLLVLALRPAPVPSDAGAPAPPSP